MRKDNAGTIDKGNVMKIVCCLTVWVSLTIGTSSPAQVLFIDDFEGGAAPEWGNEYGDWVAEDGLYTASIQSNDPPTYTSVTSLPELADFVVELDILGVRDGGVFLHSQRCENGAVEGVLFVVGGYVGSYNGCYWHICSCDGVSAPLNHAEVPGLQNSNVRIRIVVSGDVYSAYLDDAVEPLTSLTTDSHPSGSVALYEYIDQYFDNVVVLGAMVGVDGDRVLPQTEVYPAYPSPFNAQTTIAYAVDSPGPIRLRVHDLRGRLITTLVNESVSAGRHEVTWNGRNDSGTDMPSGVYLSRLESSGQVAHGRMTLVR
jgi:hypothetical protein